MADMVLLSQTPTMVKRVRCDSDGLVILETLTVDSVGEAYVLTQDEALALQLALDILCGAQHND
jgi:hypothetical protein